MSGPAAHQDRTDEATAVVARGASVDDRPATPGLPALRFSARARSIPDIEAELARIWSIPKLTTTVDGVEERHIAARTSVLNLVVIAGRPEIGERCAAIISQLAGRHPSRTLIVSEADPDGPNWLDAQVQAYCVLPHEDAPETCAELIYMTAGGETGRHLAGIVAPLVVHDLPVTAWWPGEPPFRSAQARELFTMADRLVVDGSTWTGDGLARLRQLADAGERYSLALSDFALIRQSRWREAIASIFDVPEFLPYLRSVRRVSVTYATRDESGAPGSTNVVKPIYHVAWLGSRLGMAVAKALRPADARPGGPAPRTTRGGRPPVMSRGLVGQLRGPQGDVAVVVRPVLSPMAGGTTLRVELLAERRGSELRADVTAEAETVNVRVWQDGVELLSRRFLAARRTDLDLLAESIEATGRDEVTRDAIRFAAELVSEPPERVERSQAFVSPPEEVPNA